MAIGPSVGFMKRFNPGNMNNAAKKPKMNAKAPSVTMNSKPASRQGSIFSKAPGKLKIRKDWGI